jgi:uncharacterized protein (DUF1499 family)
MLLASVLGISLFEWGSQSSDIASIQESQNPLPPCPDSPNCIRITRSVNAPVDVVFKASELALQSMKPAKLASLPEEYRLESVFKVFIFHDDMVLQCSEKDARTTYLHIRSASRVGYSDLGVNTKRVKRFLRRLRTQ